MPITLGSEFKSFATTVSEDIERVNQLKELLYEVNLGGTAVGTGINTPKGYAEAAVAHLANISGYELVPANDLIEASSDLGGFVTFSGVLKRVAVKLSKICNDLRLLSSGPRAGLGEIILPAVQAGSSIMPGKVNPVIPEVVNQVAYQVIGNDLTVTMASESGQLQLNAFEPVIIYKVLESMRMLSRAMAVLTDRCVTGIQADEARCEALLNGSLVFATALARGSATRRRRRSPRRPTRRASRSGNLQPRSAGSLPKTSTLRISETSCLGIRPINRPIKGGSL